jgi:hypothetical protein
VAALLVLALPSRADSVYEITGTATLTGNNVCGGPCIETIDFTFDFTEQLAATSYGNLYTLNLVGESSTSSGPLDSLSLVLDKLLNPMPGTGSSNANYLAFQNSGIDEIDLWVNENDQPLPFIPTIAGTSLYGCNSAPCIADFCPSSFPCDTSGQNFGILLDGTVTSATRSITTPEPSELGLLALGGALLALCALCGWVPIRKSAYPRNLLGLAPTFTGPTQL